MVTRQQTLINKLGIKIKEFKWTLLSITATIFIRILLNITINKSSNTTISIDNIQGDSKPVFTISNNYVDILNLLFYFLIFASIVVFIIQYSSQKKSK